MKKAFTLAEVLMPKRTSGIENKVLYSRESEGQAPSKTNKKLAAFTLAEVLITLAIIGVVAALTIPVVVHKYQQQQLYTQFMKEFNTLQKVVQMVIGENGAMGSWYDNTKSMDEIFDTYFLPHLQVASVSNSLPSYNIKTLDGTDLGSISTIVANGGTKSYILNDGSSILIGDSFSNSIIFAFDTNGQKAPNTMGRDIFIIELADDNYNNHNGKYVIKSQFETGDDNARCSLTGNEEHGIRGLGCADRLLKEGKMNY